MAGFWALRVKASSRRLPTAAAKRVVEQRGLGNGRCGGRWGRDRGVVRSAARADGGVDQLRAPVELAVAGVAALGGAVAAQGMRRAAGTDLRGARGVARAG